MDLELADEKGENEKFASLVEKFIANVYAPELLSSEGRVAILTLWVVFSLELRHYLQGFHMYRLFSLI